MAASAESNPALNRNLFFCRAAAAVEVGLEAAAAAFLKAARRRSLGLIVLR